MSPQVSVVLPTYNRARTLPRAIKSVLNQSYDEYELVIVDDGSTDNTDDVVRRFTDDRITYVKFEKNRGQNAARNRGIAEATGEYVSFLDSDDELLETHLESVTARLESTSQSIAGVCTAYEIITEEGRKSSMFQLRDEIIELEDIVNCNIIGSFSCTTFRKSIFDKIGYPDENFPAMGDYEFYIRVLKDYKISGINEILTRYYVHNNQLSNNNDKKSRAKQQLVEKHSPIVSEHRSQKEHIANVDWDWLVVCSGGRYDILRELFGQHFTIETTPVRVHNNRVVSISDWMGTMFPRTYEGLFVHGGQPVHSMQGGGWDERDHFETVPSYTEFDWDAEYNTCRPGRVNDIVREYLPAHDRGVVRFLQPRPPFRQLSVPAQDRTARIQRIANAVRANELSLEAVMAAYRDSYEWVLAEGITDLLPDLDGTIIVTADHGECLGDCGQWFHGYGYDPHHHLVTVPWVVIQ